MCKTVINPLLEERKLYNLAKHLKTPGRGNSNFSKGMELVEFLGISPRIDQLSPKLAEGKNKAMAAELFSQSGGKFEAIVNVIRDTELAGSSMEIFAARQLADKLNNKGCRNISITCGSPGNLDDMLKGIDLTYSYDGLETAQTVQVKPVEKVYVDMSPVQWIKCKGRTAQDYSEVNAFAFIFAGKPPEGSCIPSNMVACFLPARQCKAVGIEVDGSTLKECNKKDANGGNIPLAFRLNLDRKALKELKERVSDKLPQWENWVSIRLPSQEKKSEMEGPDI